MLKSICPPAVSTQRLFPFVGLIVMLVGLLMAWPQTVAAQGTGTVVTDITTDTVWTKAGSPYQLASTAFAVEAGATLTIQPGVEVIAPAHGHFQVRGRLIAQGTAGEPIRFTGVNKTPGGWYGITVSNSREAPASATLDHVIVEYGSVPELEYGGITVNYGALTLTNSQIRNSGSYGLVAEMHQPVQIANTLFADNGRSAVRLEDTAYVDPVLSNLTATGNGANAVTYYGVNITDTHTLEPMGLPYIVEGGLFVRPTGHLIVQPGIEVQTIRGFGVDGGRLTAIGTADQPILFTGVNKTPGGWWGITIGGDTERLAHATFDHVIIEYGGTADSDYSANLVVTSAVVTVTNSIVRNGPSHGIADHGGAPDEGHQLTVINTSILDNAKSALLMDDESADPIVRALTVTGNGQNGLVQDAPIAGDHRWENVGLPYLVAGDLGIYNGALTIEPGVTVQFAAAGRMQVNGSLYAIGTITQPIVFTGPSQQPGSWGGIQYNGSESTFLVLRYCDIGYGGQGQGMLRIYAPSAFVTNCAIHHSADDGIEVQTGFSQPVISRNRIENNAFGLENRSSGRVVIDATDNWWGAASGPAHATNPQGAGNGVSDGVLFNPWLQSPEQIYENGSGLIVRLSGPGRFSPGDTEQYQVYYANLTDQPIENAVLRVALPAQADYLDNTGGGIYWPQREQVYWKLGTVAPGQQDYVAVRVRYHWGLPDGLRATTVAQVSGTNLAAPVFDVAPYLEYQPRIQTASVDLSAAEAQALRNAHPDLAQLYDRAIAQGYVYASAAAQTYNTGDQATVIALLRFQPSFSIYELWLVNGKAIGLQIDDASYSVYRTGGGLRYDLATNAWAPATNGLIGPADLISWEACMANCIEEKLPGYIIKKRIKALSEVSKAVDCIKSVQGDEGSYLGCSKKFLGKVAPGYSEAVDLGQCNLECQTCQENGIGCNDPNCHCCTESKYRCDNDDSLYGIFGISVIKMRKCDNEDGEGTGQYLAETVIKLCPLCNKCVDSGDHMACVARTLSLMAQGLTGATLPAAQLQADSRLNAIADGDLTCDECLRAKDPNELFGPQDDLLPGQLLTYTITYENVGAGEAHDVFVVDELSEHFDLSTLQIHGPGSFSPGARSIFWSVGTLAPKGQPGSTGVISFTVRLKAGLSSDTIISNQAVVHFPSVPEVTPTNTWVNVVQPLAAIPQELTSGGQPVNFTLQGRDVSNTPLTFAVVEGPFYGTLSGTPPALTYTPAPGFTGLERIAFTVSNGTATSRPAEIAIVVDSDNGQAPAVLWTTPANGAQLALGEVTPIPGPDGALYAPQILVQFSEPMDASTVTTRTIEVKTAAGQAVPLFVQYDGRSDQALILFKEAPQSQAVYTVTVPPAVKDRRGNALAAPHTWSFQVGAVQPTSEIVYLPLVRR
jgi:hypothetical protein